MNISEELIAADMMGASEGPKVRERLFDIFKEVQTVMDAMKELVNTSNPPPPPH